MRGPYRGASGPKLQILCPSLPHPHIDHYRKPERLAKPAADAIIYAPERADYGLMLLELDNRNAPSLSREELAMATIDRSLYDSIMRTPSQKYHAIIRTDRYLSIVAEACVEHGISIQRQFRLIRALAVYGEGSLLLILAEHPHVKHIESDDELCL